MSGFLDMVARDNVNVFLNLDEFAKDRTIRYNGNTYADVACVVTSIKEQDRNTLMSDHSQGLYRATSVLHCTRDALDGYMPEKGARLDLSDEDGPTFFWSYYVAASGIAEGMLRVELEAQDE